MMINFNEEEAIEILEKMLKREKEALYEFDITNEEVQAIENLIQRNKELSKLLEEKTMRIGFENIDNYIPKSKVKERYEQLKHYDYIEIKELLKLLGD